MNELSWLIYAADVAGTLKWVAMATVSVSVLTALGAYMSRAYNGDMARIFSGSRMNEGLIEKHNAGRDAANKMLKPCGVVAAISAAVMVFAPASTTIYAIAASEMGERVLQSETGGKAVQALNAWLDKQIAKQ